MQIDFHTASERMPVKRSRGGGGGAGPSLPLYWRRVIGIAVTSLGLILVLFSLSTLLISHSSTPYAIILFEQESASKPQTHVSIVWINEAKNSIQLTMVPDSLEFHSQSLGTYPIESIYAAHTTTKQPDADFLTDLSFYLRFPIRAYAKSTSPISVSKTGLARFLLSACRTRTTSLTVGECLHEVLFVSSFSTGSRELTFPQSALGTSSVESIKPLDRSKYREWSQSHFSESFQIWKKYTVAVLNGTQTSGLATTASSIISDFGLSVLYIGEARMPQAKGEIVISTKASQNPAVGEFLHSTLRMPSTVDDTLPTQYRSDVVVIIGESEKKFFTP